MLTSQELTNLLRERGYKVTPQRLAVYEALADETWHPNAEMLFNKLQPLCFSTSCVSCSRSFLL